MFVFRSIKVNKVCLFSEASRLTKCVCFQKCQGEPSVFVFRSVKVNKVCLFFRSVKVNQVCLFSDTSR